MTILLDSSVLIAYLNRRDRYHAEASRLLPGLLDEKVLLAEPVLQELFYVLGSRVGYSQAVDAVATITDLFQIQSLELEDFHKMIGIMRKYADASFDYADVALMALADRFFSAHIATFDRRDFQIFRNRWGDPIPLLP
ncbi:MAG: PIN domain-containing protein [Anaerolineae bacterium]|nr:PIN domain-containing protein [Anaerolineae bacterium]